MQTEIKTYSTAYAKFSIIPLNTGINWDNHKQLVEMVKIAFPNAVFNPTGTTAEITDTISNIMLFANALGRFLACSTILNYISSPQNETL